MANAIFYSRWSPHVLSVLRIVIGLLFLEHGTQKILGFPLSPNPPPALLSLQGLQGAIELVGGLLILVGLFTRPVAFILAGEMAVAYFQFHFPHGFWPVANGGVSAALYCFVWLYFSAAGAGPWSLDTVRAKRATPRL